MTLIKKDFFKNLIPLSIHQREIRLEKALVETCKSILHPGDQKLTSKHFQSNLDLLEEVKVNYLFEKILKVANYAIKFFNNNFHGFDKFFLYNDLVSSLKTKHIELLYFKTSKTLSPDLVSYTERSLPAYLHLSILRIQQLQYDLYTQELSKLSQYCKEKTQKTEDSHKQMWNSLPQLLQDQIISLSVHRGLSVEEVQANPSLLIQKDPKHLLPILDELQKCYREKNEQIDRLAQDKYKEVAAIPKLTPHGRAIDPTKHRHVFSASTEDLHQQVNQDKFLNNPISTVLASVEYAGFVNEGGLAEAVEGLTKGLTEQHKDNKITLVFPKFSHLHPDILTKLQNPQEYKTAAGVSYTVYSYERNGVQCRFIDHPAFQMPPGWLSVYGPTEVEQNERFAAFSAIGADYIGHHLENVPDIVHIHDWHVAGIGLELKKQREANKDTTKKDPAIVFTIHNNGRASQGRVGGGGIYNYQNLAPAYVKWGIIPENTNLVIEMMQKADFVTTVSGQFAIETQDGGGEDPYGMSSAARDVAREGKYIGILNGANPHSFNPETDPVLKNWKDVETGEFVDLTYGPKSDDILVKKRKGKEQLQKWVAKYMPEAKIDFSKPIVMFLGRFDSLQKGLDKMEEAIKSTLANGGQFICMGVGDRPGVPVDLQQDKKATAILDELQAKYTEGVLWLRDYKEAQEEIDKQTGKVKKLTKLHYQHGSADRPGIGPLVRATVEYLFAPSKFEPCGLVQFEAWLFGALAIGSSVGGLRDTIVSPEENKEEFNGFLFHRDPSDGPSCSEVIKKALDFWNSKDDSFKIAMMQRVITRGRKSGWNVRPSEGKFSPVEYYRMVYHLAQERVASKSAKVAPIEQVLQRLRILPPKPTAKRATLEEIYLANYTHAESTKITSEELEQLYLQLPEEIRSQCPPPYGINVNHTKYLEYGAFHAEKETTFKVYAPNAKTVEIVLFDEGESQTHVYAMDQDAETGSWKRVVDNLPVGQRYQYRINGVVKLDPYSRQVVTSKDNSNPPYSVVSKSTHQWTDQAWMKARSSVKNNQQGMSIYEIHPTTWKKKDGKYLNYRELAHELVAHVKKGGFTHVEMMGLLEHPDERSWGYQVTGFFAPNSRLGSVDDFKYFVNYLHENNIGVILDFVPGHFAKDAYGLGNFDGTHLFEPENTLGHAMSIRNLFHNFGATHFDFGKESVREFLTSSACFWLKEMGIDGLRVDCIASVLWGDKPSEAARFLKDLNAIVHRDHQGAFTIAEDYSGNPTLLRRFANDGMGFDFKWNVNWVHKAKDYFSNPVNSRKSYYHQIKELIFDHEAFYQIPYISHDELNTDAGEMFSSINKISSEEKLANWKSIISLLMTSQGHKLMFSGVEIAHDEHWNKDIGKPEGLMNRPLGVKQEEVLKLVNALNRLYVDIPLMHAPSSGRTVEWIEDPKQVVHGYRIRDDKSSMLILHNFTNKDVSKLNVNLPHQRKSLITDQNKLTSEREVELKRNLDRIDHKMWLVVLRVLVDRVLSFVLKVDRQWVRLYVDRNGKKTPLLLKVKKIQEVTLATYHQVVNYSQKELLDLLSTPVITKEVNPQETLNSDANEFGGKNRLNSKINIVKQQKEGVIYEVQVPAMSSVIIKEYGYENK